jgi:RES domain-containing protein
MADEREARDLELLDAIDRLERHDLDGKVWRVVRESRNVLQGSAMGARWDPGHFDVLYTSLERDGALEEIYFHLTRQPVFPSTIRFQAHRIRVRATKLLRLEKSTQLQDLGVDVTNYSGFDYSRTQAIADAAYFLGFEGLIVPSARCEALNLVLFSDHIEPTDLEVEDSEFVNWKQWRESR